MKKLLPLIVLAVAFSIAISVPVEASFDDVPDNYWASDYIAYAEENNLIHGMGDGTFQPEGTLTEAQCCQILANINGEVGKAAEGEAWYVPAVTFIEGRTGLTIQPEAEATREFLCRLFYWYEIENPRVTFYGLGEMPFTDCEGLSVESKNAIRFCVRNDIVCGFPDGTFRPDESLTRAQGAKVFSVLYDYYEDEMTAEEQTAWDKADELVAYAEELGLTVDVYSVRNDTEFYWCIQVYAVSGEIDNATWGIDEDPVNRIYIAHQFLVGFDDVYEVMLDGATTQICVEEAKNLMVQTADTMVFWQKSAVGAKHMRDFAVDLGWGNYEFLNETGIFSTGAFWGCLNIGKISRLELSIGGYGSGPVIYCIINGGCHSVPRAEVELWFKSNPQEPLA